MSALRDLVGSGAECSGGNSLTQFTKQLQQDRSLQQDRFGGPEDVGSSSPFGLRERPLPAEIARERELAEEFFRDGHQAEPHFQAPDMFNMGSLGKELEAMGPEQPMMGVDNWAVDFARQADATVDPAQFAEFEDVFQRHRETQQAVPHTAPEMWANEFHARRNEMHVSHMPHETEAELERAFEQAKHQATWEAEFAKTDDATNWANEFANADAQSWINEFTEQQGIAVDAADSKEALARTAGLLLDAVQGSDNPKFRESKFLSFMKQLRDQEVSIEGNKVVEQITPFASADSWAKEFGASINKQSWEEEFNVQTTQPSANPAMWAEEFAGRQEADWATEFQGNGPKLEDKNWTAEFERQMQDRNWAEEFAKNVPGDLNSDMAALEDIYKSAWDYEDTNFTALNEGRAIGARYDQYEFTANNPYLSRQASPTHRNLTESILVLEAAVQHDPTNAKAWYELGVRQQENENDVAAIAALRQAVRNEPSLLDSWIALAVSYTNESAREDAYDALESWMMHSDKYKSIAERNTSGHSRHEQITNMFIEAARMSAGESLDADVQVGLGVLFNISEEYQKAVDCFEAALSKRPEDYLLWNKLGATLANSSNSDRAIDAYFRALDINPSYIRARYNLAISCIQMGQHREAAEHLLGALSVQTGNIESVLAQTKGKGRADESEFAAMHSVQSQTVWSTLKMVADGHLGRHDLAEACEKRDLDAFRGEFHF